MGIEVGIDNEGLVNGYHVIKPIFIRVKSGASALTITLSQNSARAVADQINALADTLDGKKEQDEEDIPF